MKLSRSSIQLWWNSYCFQCWIFILCFMCYIETCCCQCFVPSHQAPATPPPPDSWLPFCLLCLAATGCLPVGQGQSVLGEFRQVWSRGAALGVQLFDFGSGSWLWFLSGLPRQAWLVCWGGRSYCNGDVCTFFSFFHLCFLCRQCLCSRRRGWLSCSETRHSWFHFCARLSSYFWSNLLFMFLSAIFSDTFNSLDFWISLSIFYAANQWVSWASEVI